MYIAPIKKNIPIEDGQPDSSDSDDDERPITKSKKSNKATNKNNVIVISDDEEYIPKNYLYRATNNNLNRSRSTNIIGNNSWLQSSSSSQNANQQMEDNSLSVNEFRLNILNKLHSDYGILEGSSTIINIRSRAYICDDILNWINSVQVNDLIKNPIVNIENEE